MQVSERLLMNHKKTLGFLASEGGEFNLGPESRLDRSELCNKALLKYKGDRESFDIGIRREQKEYPLASVSYGVIYSPTNQKNVWKL